MSTARARRKARRERRRGGRRREEAKAAPPPTPVRSVLRVELQYADAVQNLMLYLSEAGLASKWTTGLITRDQRFFDLLGADSDKEYVVGLIWYGYPKVLPTQTRKDVDDIVTETD